TPAMALLAAWQVLLSRTSGQQEVAVGSPIANRTQRELEPLIGFFVNTLVMRTDLSGNPSLIEVLRRVQEVSLGAYEHQDVPFEQVVEELNPPRDQSRSPLFQVMFVMQNTPREAPRLGDLEIGSLPLQTTRTRFDLELHFFEHQGRLIYNVDLFERSTVERMAGHLVRLLEAMASEPSRRLSELSLLSEQERHQLLEWNDTAAAYPDEPCIHELFEEQVKRTPEAIAVVFDEQKLSYAELNARANQLAHTLRARSMDADDLVGLCVERSPEMVVGMLGILKAAAAYVPLDPTYPQERLAFMLEDSGVSVLLTQERLLELLPEHEIEVLCLDRDASAIASASTESPPATATADHLAYVIYTSGSSGRPKGVALAHAGAAALLRWGQTVVDEDDRRGMLASTSICFDLSVFELFLPLTGGGTVILAHNALALPTLPARGGEVTLVNTVPSALAALIQQAAVADSVRTVCLAGEPLRPDLVDRIYDAGVTRVFDLYGPSEDSTYSTCALRERQGPETIGRPIANKQIYILDRYGGAAPAGVAGELTIGGSGMARGYHRRPALTAERFVPDPFSDQPGVRLYRTGDLARWRGVGTIEFVGRVDHQVKLRGYRIELGEIEVVLEQHPRVNQAVAVLREDRPGDRRLVVYLVSKDIASLGVSEVEDYLSSRLPAYMVPSAIVMLESLPRTPTGKVDRKALPAPDLRDRAAGFVAPRNGTEEVLCAIWGDVLGLERVGVHDDFFALGGHSLLATQLTSRIRSTLEIEVRLRDIFDHPTVSKLGERIRSAG
ncbi:MAG: amino acid adenylation domain-containing protein, partial [bacterium]|nr:amino acid adenylation domain-containing protein [bacterium]